MLRVAAHLSISFREYPFYERFQRAADIGFTAVEFMSPFDHDVDRIARAVKDASLTVVQFNFFNGDLAAGERGFASHPDQQERWRQEFTDNLQLAQRLGARQLTSLAGCVVPGLDRKTQLDCLVDNLGWATSHLEKAGIPMMLEALNPYENSGYLLTRSADVLGVLERVDSPWVKFQYDVYHMQRTEGDLVNTIRRDIETIGYVHIADNPGRHQPGTGEINYRFVLGALDEAGYEGYIGLEYVPLGSTEDSFEWLPREKRGGTFTADDLNL
jgi:hydroxypyruvate isomerase